MLKASEALIKLSKAPEKVVDVLAVLIVAAMLHHRSGCDVLKIQSGIIQLCSSLLFPSDTYISPLLGERAKLWIKC